MNFVTRIIEILEQGAKLKMEPSQQSKECRIMSQNTC